jgi:hypothetical protein
VWAIDPRRDGLTWSIPVFVECDDAKFVRWKIVHNCELLFAVESDENMTCHLFDATLIDSHFMKTRAKFAAYVFYFTKDMKRQKNTLRVMRSLR